MKKYICGVLFTVSFYFFMCAFGSLIGFMVDMWHNKHIDKTNYYFNTLIFVVSLGLGGILHYQNNKKE